MTVSRSRAVAVGAIVLAAATLALSQPRIARNEGAGYDGVEYLQVAEQIRAGDAVRGDAPFVARVGTPLVAAAMAGGLGSDTLTGFLVVGLAAGAVFFVLLHRYLGRTGSSPGWALALVALALTSWVMPWRFAVFYPAASDPLFLALMVAVLLVIERTARTPPAARDVVALGALLVAGGLCREQTAVVALAAAAQLLVRSGRTSAGRWGAAVAVAAAAVGVGLARLLTTPTGDYSYVSEAVDWFGRHGADDLLLALYLAFGLVTAVAIAFGDQVARWLVAEPYRVVIVAGGLVLAWIGGSDVERLLLPVSPLLFAGVGRVLTTLDWSGLGRRRRALTAVLAVLVVLLAAGLLLPLRDSLDPFDLDAAGLLRDHHAPPLLSVVNAPSFVANHVTLTPVLYRRALLAQWLAVTLGVVLLLRPEVGRRLRRAIGRGPGDSAPEPAGRPRAADPAPGAPPHRP